MLRPLMLLLYTSLLSGITRSVASDSSNGSPPGTTFSVPRIRQQNHTRDGFRAKQRVFRRRGWKLPDRSVLYYQDFVSQNHQQQGAAHQDAIKAASSQAAAVASTTVTGSVFATPEPYHSEYLSPATVGSPAPQHLMLDFDTGSSDLWVFSAYQPANQTAGHAAFDPARSSSWRNMTGATWHIQYGDGTDAYGLVGTDVVTVGGAVVKAQVVEVATNVSDEFVVDVDSDGLVGLGFRSINSVRPNRAQNFFANIMPSLRAPIFTANLQGDGSGTYDFGFANTSHYRATSLVRIPVDTSWGFWLFNSTIVGVKNSLYYNTNPSPAIADTGTSLLIMDPWVADGYWNAVAGSGLSDYYGGYVFPCSQAASLPSFQIIVGQYGALGAYYVVKVPPSMINYAQVDWTFCYGGIQSNEGYGLQILGDIMFRNAFVVFYGTPGQEALGFADKT